MLLLYVPLPGIHSFPLDEDAMVACGGHVAWIASEGGTGGG